MGENRGREPESNGGRKSMGVGRTGVGGGISKGTGARRKGKQFTTLNHTSQQQKDTEAGTATDGVGNREIHTHPDPLAIEND